MVSHGQQLIVRGLLFFSIFVPLLCEEQRIVRFDNVWRIKVGEFDTFIKKPTITAVYFMLKEPASVNVFLEQFDKAGALLDIYNVKVGMVDCKNDKLRETVKHCKYEKVDHSVFAFRDGHEMLDLPLENMFDVNSIMSNLLQLVLLKEVPIVQNRHERNQLLQKNKGHRDVFFAFQKAIGTYEHKSLMEVAYAFQSHYKFAITTDEAAVTELPGQSSKKESQIWVFHCEETKTYEECPITTYQDGLDLVSLTRFAKALQLPSVHDTGSDGDDVPFEKSGIFIATIFYDSESVALISDIVDQLEPQYRGLVGFLLVNTAKQSAAKYGHIEQLKIPRLALTLRNGANVLMEVDLSAKSVLKFLNAELGIQMENQPNKVIDRFQKNELKEEELLAAVEQQDDQIAEAVFRMRKTPVNTQYVPALTDKTFLTTLKEKDFAVILYYLQFDAVSMAFLRSYSDASQVLAKENLHPLAAVNCFDWTDVCGQNNITVYPTVRIYRKNKEFMVYKGMLDASAVVTTVKLLLADEVSFLTTQGEATQFVDGEYPDGLGQLTDVAVLGLFTAEHSKELMAFKSAAKDLHGTLQFGYTSEEVTNQMSSKYETKAPSIVVVKRHDSLEPFAVVKPILEEDKLVEAVKKASHPAFPELTVKNFPALFAMKKPFTILFDENVEMGSGAHGVIEDLISSMKLKNTIFCWMDLMNGEGIAGKILLEYNSGAEPPSIVHVNHAKGSIHNFNLGELSKDKLKMWLEAVERGTIPPSKMLREGEWKPQNPGYDFLKMMDEEAREDSVFATSDTSNLGNNRVDNIDSTRDQVARAELHKFRKENEPGQSQGFRRSYKAPVEVTEDHVHTEL